MEAGGAAGWAQGSPAWLHRRPRRRRCKSDPGVLSPPFAPRPAQCRVEVESPGGAGPEPQRAPLLGAAAKGSWKWGIWDHCSYLWFWRRIAGIIIAVAVILLLLWYSLSPPRLPHIEPCPDDWLYYRKKCYYLSEDQADWTFSQNFCLAHGASLAVIDSKQEMHFIMNRMRTRDFWIGLYKQEDEFHWLSGEALDTNLFYINISRYENCGHTASASISASKCRLKKKWLCSTPQLQSSTLSL